MVYFRLHVARILRGGVIQQAHRQNKAGLRVQVSWGQTRLSEVPLEKGTFQDTVAALYNNLPDNHLRNWEG